jgi:hypothetical protein
MANGCAAFGRIIPDAYIDKVFLEEALIDTNNDGTVDTQTPKITVNVKLVDQLNDNGTYSLLGDVLNQQQEGSANPVDLKEMFWIRCVMTTSEASTEAFEEALVEETGAHINQRLNLAQNAVHRIGDYSAYTTLNAITSTYTNSDGDVELIKSFTFDLPEGAIIEHLHVFAFVQLQTAYLASQLNLIVPEPLEWKMGKVEQEMVIENSQVVSMRRGFEAQGVTTNVENHVHGYDGLTVNGDGYTAYAVHPDESEIRHRHQVIDGVVQSAQSNCWRADPTDPESCQEIYSESRVDPDGARRRHQGPAGVGPHIHQLQSKWEPISNVQDFRIRDEIDVLIAEFTSLTQAQESFPGQKDIIAPIMSNDSYFSELFLTKDENKGIRFLFAFDYGKFCIEKSKYYHIISKFPDSTKQAIVNNSTLTQFIISRRQVREKPAQNSLGSPVRDRVMDDGSIEIPIVTSLGSNAISEINLLLPNQSPTGGSSLRYFTGIDIATYFPKSDGFYQYSIDIEIIDGFVPIIQANLDLASRAAYEYQPYVALTEIPGVYDRLSRKFTTKGIDILSTHPAGLDQIVNGYLNGLGMWIDLDSFIPETIITKRFYYGAKILNLISPETGSIDGVLLFDKLLTLLVSQITNLMKIGHSGGGVEDTVANQPSDRTSLFKPQAMKIKEYFENTIGARYLNESHINNVSNVSLSGFAGLSTYSQAELLAATQEEVNLDSISNRYKSIEEVFGEAGITYNIVPLTTTTTAPTQQLVSAVNFTSFSPGATGDLNVNILSPQDLAVPEVILDPPPEQVFAPLLQSLRDTPETTSDQLQVEVDVLTEFGSTVPTPTDPSVATISMRNVTFQAKPIGQLVVAPGMGNVFYLCRQTRRSDVEVLNSYFLVSPAESTGATGTTSNIRPGTISAAYNHTHTYTIDAYGNGSTSVGGDNSHTHQISNFVVSDEIVTSTWVYNNYGSDPGETHDHGL